MKSKATSKLEKEERKAFLKLNPVDRILSMERLLHEVISIKAEEEGVSEGEIYNRFLAQKKIDKSRELIKKVRKDRKLQGLLKKAKFGKRPTALLPS